MRRQVNVIKLSEARQALVDHYVSLVTPKMIEDAIRSGTALGPKIDQLERGSVVDEYREKLGQAALGTNYMVLIVDDANPNRVWTVAVKDNEFKPTSGLFADIVKAGIALLDKEGPSDWRRQIDLTQLDLSEHRRCVLGQIYNNYSVGFSKLCEGNREGDGDGRFSAQHGFDYDVEYNLVELDSTFQREGETDQEFGYRLLTDEWKRQLSK